MRRGAKKMKKVGIGEGGRGGAKSLYQSLRAILHWRFWGKKWIFALKMPGKSPQTLPRQKRGKSEECLSVAL